MDERWEVSACDIYGPEYFGKAINSNQAKRIAKRHNADCDRYEARIAELEAERDELKRRLDAVVMEHIRTAELKCYCEFDRDHTRTLECEYCEEVTSLRAIAEGRDNG